MRERARLMRKDVTNKDDLQRMKEKIAELEAENKELRSYLREVFD